MEYIDHLKEHMRGLAEKYVEGSSSLPIEFKDIEKTRLINLIEDMATPILRKIEHDAIDAAVARSAELIRFSLRR